MTALAAVRQTGAELERALERASWSSGLELSPRPAGKLLGHLELLEKWEPVFA